jgi:hypothetical protein
LPFLGAFLPEKKRQGNSIGQGHSLVKFWGALRARHGKVLLKPNRLGVKIFSRDMRGGFMLPVCEN